MVPLEVKRRRRSRKRNYDDSDMMKERERV
jgi:hypothetical protein